MKYVNLKSASFTVAIIIGVASTTAAQAQGSQGPSMQAGVQTPSNVNVVNVPTVTVGNTALQPIPVMGPIKEPVHANFSLTIAFGLGASNIGTYSVPTGKRLVIEHLAAGCRSTQETDVIINVKNDTQFLTFLLTRSVPFINFPGEVISTGALPLSAYVDQGTVTVQASRTSANVTTTCTATVLGYLTPIQ
jgi:hypothetical protein